jgi:hypothetical protein
VSHLQNNKEKYMISFSRLNPRSKSAKFNNQLSKVTELKPLAIAMAKVVNSMTGKLNGIPFWELSKRRMANCCYGLVKSTVECKYTKRQEDRISDIKRCRVSVCPICSDKRTNIARAVHHKVNQQLITEYSDDTYISVTLTMEQCKADKIRESVTKLNKALETLFSYKKSKKFRLPHLGYVKFLHIRRNKRNHAQPHIHVLIHMPKNYRYDLITEPELQRLWMKAMKSTVPLVVDIQLLKSTVEDLTRFN